MEDRWSRAEYRRVIAWEKRIAREAPFLLRQLEAAPDASVLDLGCGTGEHAAFFAAQGARAVGLDASASMLEDARDHESEAEPGSGGSLRFVEGDLRDAVAALGRDEKPFGLALCLGNVLPHLVEEEDLARFAASVAAALRPGGRLLLQLLNYTRILASGLRHLPVNVREGEDGRETVFLRLLGPVEDGRILFFPTTLELDPESETPVTVQRTKRVPLRAWEAPAVARALSDGGFEVTLCGDMEGGAFDPSTSADLVVVAERRRGA